MLRFATQVVMGGFESIAVVVFHTKCPADRWFELKLSALQVDIGCDATRSPRYIFSNRHVRGAARLRIR
jgi:hypothetical protein